MNRTQGSVRFLSRTLAIALLMFTGTGRAEELTPQEGPSEVEEGEARTGRWLKNIAGTGVDVKALGSIEVAYDDNVFRYSDADRGAFNRNDSTRQTQFRHVNHIDDVVTVPRLGIGLKKSFVKHRPTEISFATTMHLYGADTVKNYQEYDVHVKQRLGKGLMGRAGYSHTPEFVLRNLFDTDQPSGQEYQLATYSQHTLWTSLWVRLTSMFRTRARYEVAFKDYNSFFDERDSTTHTWDLTGYSHLFDWLVWRLNYEIIYSDARASDGDPDVDPDTSYLQNGFGTRLDVAVMKRLIVRLFYAFGYRDFLTDHSSTDDRLHRNREDIRQTVGVRAAYEVSKDGEVYLQWERHANNTDISVATGVRGDTDVLGYDQDVLTVGFTFRF